MAAGLRIVALLLVAVGVALVVDAVRRGDATLSLLVIFPIVSGASAEFALGTLALLIGTILGFASLVEWGGTVGSDAGPPRSQSGGVVLIGPIPIFFGSARPASRRTTILWVAVGVALTAGSLLAVWVLA